MEEKEKQKGACTVKRDRVERNSLMQVASMSPEAMVYSAGYVCVHGSVAQGYITTKGHEDAPGLHYHMGSC